MSVVIKPFEIGMLESLKYIENRVRESESDFPSWANWAYLNNPELKKSNMFVALIDNEFKGYGHLLPRPAFDDDPPKVAHTLYFDFNVLPDIPESRMVLKALYTALHKRGQELLAELPSRQAEWCIQHYGSVKRQLDFVQSLGFKKIESYMLLERSFEQSVSYNALPEELSLFQWEMDTQQDQNTFLELEKLCFPEETPTLDKLSALKGLPAWRTYAAAESDGTVVGLIMVHMDLNRKKGYIDDLFTVPAYRSRGVARALLGAGIQYLSDLGSIAVQLHVSDSNLSAFRLYRQIGFEIIKEQLEFRKSFAEQE
ncbi:GNAT family N-acetyltransferase [Paenibacillus kyungheensis]|uniref:GNAT family N-acetyltransferase n=1 Tax=Paenibacillus kyungheensis TaxID=1452732 RepID=A0AAX3M7B8_9BACL|nr:GNAT family N-acetyltransferase [Paenibacillus kyungheensis]WCT58032.1 GNAT family N-acetyltransferase [Paenibacillus kyungheensis]